MEQVKQLCVLYHEVRPGGSPYLYVLDSVQFEQHCKLFSKLLANPDCRINPVVTFDDGHVSNYEVALPLLQNYGLTARFFITAGWTGQKPGYMGWEDLRKLHNSGQKIGAHGWSHALLTRCSPSALEMELTRSRLTLEDKLGTSITTMSLPGGRYNKRVIAACEAAGYKQVYTSEPRMVEKPATFLVGRLNIQGDATLDWLASLFEPAGHVLSNLQKQYRIKAAAKSLLGDRLYQKLWAVLNREEAHTDMGKRLRMRILHIISSGGMYGAEAVILNMSRSLRESGHHSVLGVFANSDNPNVQLHERALAEGVESHLIPCSGQVDLTVMATIRELVKQTNADVVHSHGYKADIYVYFGLRKTDMPYVSTCHTWYDNNLLVRLYGVVDRLVLRRYAGVVAVSEEVKQRLLKSGVSKNKIYLINNGIDTRPFDSAAPTLREDGQGKRPTVGLVGRLSTEKGVDLFLHAAAVVSSAIPEAMFVVIGDGPDRAQLELLIDNLNLRGSAFLLGRRDDMPSVYASLDVMVSASRKEGLPIAILEGMASRRAVIATAVGEVPTIIQHGYTGILIPSEDSNAISAAIIKLLEDGASRDRMGAAARQSVEDRFSAKRMAEDYLRVYETVATEDRNSMRPDSR